MNIKIAVISSLVLSSIATAQVVEWKVSDGGNGHFYTVGSASTPLRAIEAQELALQQGAHLLTGCGDEFAFAVTATGGLESRYYSGGLGPYIGYMRLNFGPWRWVDNSVCEFDFWNTAWGQPDNNRDVVTLLVNYNGTILMKVHDAEDFAHTRFFIMEWDADCNGDGLIDYGQILRAEIADANHNNIPDGPAILQQPVEQQVSQGSMVSFNVQVSQVQNCQTPVQYRWQKRNPNVNENDINAWLDLANDNTFANTDTSTLTILNPIPALATGYRCKISGGCPCEIVTESFIYSSVVNFSISCPADFNADGGVDFSDVEAFFERWENGC